MERFEKTLTELSKPEVGELKHTDALASIIASIRDKSVTSAWWIVVPLYILATLMMKSFFVPGTTLRSSLQEFTEKNGLLANALFLVVPSVLTIANVVSIFNLYNSFGKRPKIEFLRMGAVPLFIALLSVVCIVVYLI